MLAGIPYFGEYNQNIYNKIINSKVTSELNIDSIYRLINTYAYSKIVVVIDNKWLTWLNDIKFNYRDKKCYIPYYSYKLYSVSEKTYKYNNQGHLIIENNHLVLRYDYTYNQLNISDSNISLILYNIDTQEKFKVNTKNWISEQRFSIDKLYKLYINSSYKEDRYNIKKHLGGYHYISRQPKEFKNKEKQYRELYELDDYSKETIDCFYNQEYDDYRDVRNFKYEEVIQRYGMVDNTEIYKIRRLRFESYLYCILRADILSDNQEFNTKLALLKSGKEIIKYGSDIKLIFKRYWINSLELSKPRSWNKL